MDTVNGSGARGWAVPAVVTAAFLAPSLVPSFVGPASFGGAPAQNTLAWLVSGAVQSLSQFALLSIIIGVSGGLREYGLSKPSAGDLLKAALLAAAILGISGLASLGFGAFGGGPDGAGAASAVPPPGGVRPELLVPLSALFAVAVGYREELFYRLYVVKSIVDRGGGKAAAIAVSTALFAAGHSYQGIRGMVAAAAVGLPLATAAAAGWKLHPLAIAHAAYDFIVLASAFFGSGGL